MFLCFFCTNSFLTIETLLGHVKLKHENQRYYEVKCNIANCFNKFANTYSLLRHIKKVHGAKELIEETPGTYESQEELLPIEKTIESSHSLNTVETSLNNDFSEISNDNEVFSIDLFKKQVLHFALCFVTKLYAFGNLNRKLAHEIIVNMCSLYLNNCLNFLVKRIENTSELHQMISVIKNGFHIFRTAYLTLKYLQDINCYIPPVKIVIRSFLKFSKSRIKRHIVRKKTLSIIPIDVVLKKFLELSNVFDSITKYIEKCKNSEFVESIMQGEFWLSVLKDNSNDLFLPLIIYFDDLEIEQIQNLQTNGITINVDGKERTIFFILTHIVGDNLGLNNILGFSKSFNAHYCCRVCTVEKKY